MAPSGVYLMILEPPQLLRGDNQYVECQGGLQRTDRADHMPPALSIQRPSGYVPSGRPWEIGSTNTRLLDTFPVS